MMHILLYLRMEPNTEVKIACFNGKAEYKCSKAVTDSSPNSFKGYTDDDLFQFAERAIALLKSRDPNFFMEQIVRVDIFYDPVRKQLVVNEFESLEALVNCAVGSAEEHLITKLRKYWYNIGLSLVEFHMNRASLSR